MSTELPSLKAPEVRCNEMLSFTSDPVGACSLEED